MKVAAVTAHICPRARRSVACYWHRVSIRSDNICLELRRLWAGWGENSAVFEVNRRIKQGSGAVVWRCSLVQRDGKEQLQGAANIKS